jgi:desulfoferrodoxin-like iron-binding protein
VNSGKGFSSLIFCTHPFLNNHNSIIIDRKEGGGTIMTKVGRKYKCNICGNEVVVTHNGKGELVCCGQPMEAIGEGFQCK